MNPILNDCKKIEDASYIETTTNVKILTNVAYLITTHYRTILNLCENNFERKKLSKTSHEDIFIAYSNVLTNNNNLIITQPYLINFWEEYESDDVCVINTTSKLKEANIKNKRITIISHCVLNQQIHKIYNIPFKRILLHNCYKKYLHNKMRCDFKWYVFSDKSMMRNSDLTEEIVKHILVEEINVTDDRDVCNTVIYSKKPIESLTLEGLVDNVILDNVNKYNIKSIIKHLTDPSIKTEKDVVRYVLRRFNEQIKNIETSEHCLEQMMFVSEADRLNKTGVLMKKKTVLLEKKNELTKRITDNNLCFICYSDIEIKTILKCCSNNVCFQCINKWIKNNNTCPLCKQSQIQYFLVDDDDKEVNCFEKPLHLADENSIFENFQILISCMLPNRKVAIIGYEQMFLRKFENILRGLSIEFIKYKGNNKVLKNKLASFKNSVNVIFFDYSKVNYGIPLEHLTDIIVLSKDLNIDAFTKQCKNVENIWSLLYK